MPKGKIQPVKVRHSTVEGLSPDPRLPGLPHEPQGHTEETKVNAIIKNEGRATARLPLLRGKR